MKPANVNLAVVRLCQRLPGGDLPYPRVVECPGTVRQLTIRDADVFALLDSAEVWTCSLDAETPFSPVAIPLSVKWLACNQDVSFLVTDAGRIYGWGADTQEAGILGIPGLYASESPMLLESLSQAEIVQVAVGLTHAAALDNLGHLFAWGTGECGQVCGSAFVERKVPPRLVEGARIFTVKKVLCGALCTAICTGGGFVYVFGRFGSHRHCGATAAGRQQNQPKAPSHFEDIYASDICIGPDFLALLTEAGLVYCFDDCLDLVQLPSVSDSKVQSLCASSQALYGLSKSGGLLHEWTPAHSHYNEGYLLDRLVRLEQIPCSLHTWKGVLYLLEEPWDVALGVSAAERNWLCLNLGPITQPKNAKMHTCGQQISIIDNGKLADITAKIADSLVYDQGATSDNEGESEGDRKTFERILDAKLAEEQRETVGKAFVRILRTLFLDVIVSVNDSGASSAYRKRLHAVLIVANSAGSLRSKLLRSCLVSGFSSIKHYSDMQSFARRTRAQEEAYARMSREEAAKSLFRTLSRAHSSRYRSSASLFLEQLLARLTRYQRATTALTRVGKLLNSHWLRTQRLAVKQWRDIVMLEAMQRWRLGKLVKLLSLTSANHAWMALRRWSQWKKLLLMAFEKLVRRRTRENRREAVGRCFSAWKHNAYQLSLQRISQLQALQVSFKALHSVMRRLLRFRAYGPAFRQIEKYAIDQYRCARLRHPILFFTSIYDKIQTRTYSWAFNSLFRFNPESLAARRKQCIQALARIGTSVTRAVLRDIKALSDSIYEQMTIDLTFRLQQIIDSVQLREMEIGFAEVWNAGNSADFLARESMVLLAESEDWTTRYFSAMGGAEEYLTSRTSAYSPEETASFLTKDDDAKRKKESKTAKNRYGHKSKSSLGVSPHEKTSNARPPWRAPSRSGFGLSKKVAEDSNTRRRQYDTALKVRQSKSRLRLSSPPSDSPPDLPQPSYIDIRRHRSDRTLSQCERNLSGAYTDRREPNPMERTLSTIVGAKTLQKLQNRRTAVAWIALKKWNRKEDGFTTTLGKADFVLTFPLTQEKTHVRRASQEIVSEAPISEEIPDDQELESSWKTRLAKVGCQRIAKVVERRNADLLSTALSFLRAITLDP